jgi:acetolactate synthase-1/2/3 large subunit
MSQIKISEAVVSKFTGLGVSTAFSVSGGAAMHLNDSAENNPDLQVVYMHHEQSCAMAAEGYSRISGGPALVIVTAGPGAINAFNGVFGAFTDSIPMIILSGQARSDTQKKFYNLNSLRQLGDQEAPTLKMVESITKKTYEITSDLSAEDILEVMEEAFHTATSGRPGPVWIEIPIDVQGKLLEFNFENSKKIGTDFEPESYELPEEVISDLFLRISKSVKPVLLIGTGVKISGAERKVINFAERFDIPILTNWCHDIIETDHPLFMGRCGTIGTRAGNLILQQSDLLIVLGTRLNLRQISYNFKSFAQNAYKVQIDIDPEELMKPFPTLDQKIHSDAGSFIDQMLEIHDRAKVSISHTLWMKWCNYTKNAYILKSENYPIRSEVINPYHLIPFIFEKAEENTIFACGNATACIVPFQTAIIKSKTTLFSNGGSASMGYDLPSAIGAAIADPERPVVCFAGDGSLMMNIQELQTLLHLELNVLLLILDNNGYLSIKQTQNNFFGRLSGADPKSGVTFPNFHHISDAFGLHTETLDLDDWKNHVENLLQASGPRILVCKLDPEQEFEPRLKSRMIDGQIKTPELDDMFPFLSEDELMRARMSPNAN